MKPLLIRRLTLTWRHRGWGCVEDSPQTVEGMVWIKGRLRFMGWPCDDSAEEETELGEPELPVAVVDGGSCGQSSFSHSRYGGIRPDQ